MKMNTPVRNKQLQKSAQNGISLLRHFDLLLIMCRDNNNVNVTEIHLWYLWSEAGN